jgi:hypothetical protein
LLGLLTFALVQRGTHVCLANNFVAFIRNRKASSTKAGLVPWPNLFDATRQRFPQFYFATGASFATNFRGKAVELL